MQSNNTKPIIRSPANLPMFGFALTVYLMGIASELWAVQLLLNGWLLNSLAAHLFAALSLAWAFCNIMPRQFQPNTAIFFLFLFLCLFIPVVSGIFILLSITVGLYSSKISNNNFLEITDPEGLTAITETSNQEYSIGRIRSILKFSNEEDKRIKAVLSIRQMENEYAIPLLRIALLDTADEVRLSAYSILDKIEKNIYSVIHKGLTKLKSDHLNSDELSSIHYSLSESYWELSYLGIAEGRARIHTLNSARQHITNALKHQNMDASLHVLHARIMISLGFYKQANSALDKASEYGMPMTKIASLHAELAFEQRQFNKVAKHIRQIDTTAQTNIVLESMIKQWV